jgi:hypothetical protein
MLGLTRIYADAGLLKPGCLQSRHEFVFAAAPYKAFSDDPIFSYYKN